MRPTHLRRLFLDLSALALVGCGGSTTAIDGDVDGGIKGDGGPGTDSGILAEGFPDHACDAATGFVPLVGSTDGPAVDYVELRFEYDGIQVEPSVLGKRGAKCSKASDIAACEQKVTALRSAAGWPQPVSNLGGPAQAAGHRYLVTTKGDTVATLTSLDDLKTFLAPYEVAADGATLLSQGAYTFRCAEANVRKVGTSFEYIVYSGTACGPNSHTDRHIVRVDEDGTITVVRTEIAEVGSSNCAVGRRPEGFSTTSRGRRSVGCYFAESAALEAASISSFRRLAHELRSAKAPSSLVSRARRAAKDEIRHARVTTLLAKEHGETVPRLPRQNFAPRTLTEMAIENAVEGCVRETFGALVATVQARRISDPALGRTLSTIAKDETRHAELAWDVAAWASARLSVQDRARVDRARKKAFRELRKEVASGSAHLGDRVLGLPAPEEATRLLDMLAARLPEPLVTAR